MLTKYELSKTQRYLLYGVGLVSLIAIVFLTKRMPSVLGEVNTSILILLLSASIFVLLRAIVIRHYKFYSRHSWIILSISNLTLGIYVIHPFVINVVHQITGFEPDSFFTLWWVPVLTLIVWGISALLTLVITKIPIVKRILL